jgi:hypothetical protein
MGSLVPNPDVVWKSVGEEAVLVHLRTNRIYNLNRTGARLWVLLSQGWTRQAIKGQLLQEFDVEESSLEVEIESLLASLAAEGLIAADDG